MLFLKFLAIAKIKYILLRTAYPDICIVYQCIMLSAGKLTVLKYLHKSMALVDPKLRRKKVVKIRFRLFQDEKKFLLQLNRVEGGGSKGLSSTAAKKRSFGGFPQGSRKHKLRRSLPRSISELILPKTEWRDSLSFQIIQIICYLISFIFSYSVRGQKSVFVTYFLSFSFKKFPFLSFFRVTTSYQTRANFDNVWSISFFCYFFVLLFYSTWYSSTLLACKKNNKITIRKVKHPAF